MESEFSDFIFNWGGGETLSLCRLVTEFHDEFKAGDENAFLASLLFPCWHKEDLNGGLNQLPVSRVCGSTNHWPS